MAPTLIVSGKSDGPLDGSFFAHPQDSASSDWLALCDQLRFAVADGCSPRAGATERLQEILHRRVVLFALALVRCVPLFKAISFSRQLAWFPENNVQQYKLRSGDSLPSSIYCSCLLVQAPRDRPLNNPAHLRIINFFWFVPYALKEGADPKLRKSEERCQCRPCRRLEVVQL